MREKISRERFASFTGNDLGWELIQKVILPLRGQRLDKKCAAFEQLTPGQKDLFSYCVLAGRTQHGWLRFYEVGYASHLPVIRKGLEHIQAQALIDNLDAAGKLFQDLDDLAKQEAVERDNPEVQKALEKLYQELAVIDQGLFPSLTDASRKMEACIHAYPDEFVEFVAFFSCAWSYAITNYQQPTCIV